MLTLLDLGRGVIVEGTEPCAQSDCAEMAICIFEWPGSPPQLACARHGAGAMKLAETMGFKLAVTRAPVRETPIDSDPTAMRARELEVD